MKHQQLTEGTKENMTEDVVFSSTTLLGSWPGYFVLCHWRNNQREENTPITSMFVNIFYSGRSKA